MCESTVYELTITVSTLYGRTVESEPEFSRCIFEKAPSAPAVWLGYGQLTTNSDSFESKPAVLLTSNNASK